jgi:hypothetical protein
MARPDVQEMIRLYGEAKTARTPHEADYRKAAAYCAPQQLRRWLSSAQTFPGPGTGAENIAYDTVGMRCLPKYVSILNRLMTPQSQRWSTLTASNADLMRVYAVKKYFQEVNDKLFKKRYETRGRFIQAAGEAYRQIGLYGMGPMYLRWRKRGLRNPSPGFGYKSCNMSDIFVMADDDGNIITVFRRMWITAANFKIKFPDVTPPPNIAVALKDAARATSDKHEMFHVVTIRHDYDPTTLYPNRLPYVGCYVSVSDAQYVGEEESFAYMPYLTPRVETEADDAYGYSPAARALPALGGVSVMKKTALKAGQKAVDPPILAHDDGVLSSLDMRPGRVNFGGVSAEGRALVQPFQSGGQFNIALEQMQDERNDVEDSFFVTLFQILQENPEMTATEVMERVAEKAALLETTMGRMQAEYLGPMHEYEIALLAEEGELPQAPPELVEAKGEYTITYTSPMAKGQYAEEVSSFFRLVEVATGIAQSTGTPDPLDHFDFDAAIPEIADRMSVRAGWMSDPDKLTAKRQARQEQMQQSEMLKQAPAAASIAKAAMDKGMNVQ